ncbi:MULTISPECIES: hypothetical protein [Pantoea]|uniref:phage tail fiber protein n=1 Tax=Pantoea TaxID=53335 RepID=UPI0028AC65F0|nr:MULTISPECIES: hypothetical protein [Pantoea]MDU4129512.1 hypothetical protein [Pantoea sp.]
MSSNEITDIGVMAGKAYGTAPLSADMQYLETYTSSALNRKLKGIVRSGFYLGFSPVAGSGLNVIVTSKGAEGGQGAASVDVNAHQITVQHLADLTLPVMAGKTTRIVLEANYKLGVKTDQVDITSTVEAARVFAQDISVALKPNQLELCRVLVPTGTTQVTQAMIVTNYRINRQVGITLDSIYTSDDELIAANLKGLKILKGMIDNNMVIANNGSDIHDKAMFRKNIELDQLVNEKQLVASENLADLPDVSEARNHLGLGTAAQADQQTNPLDMTPGALMAVGAFGLGAPSLVLNSKITLLADVSVTEQNAFWTLSGTFSDGPVDLGKTTQTLSGQLFNMRRKYDADASLLQLLVAQGGMMYWRSAGKVSGSWAWSGLSTGADTNGWRKVMDSASMTLADLVKAGGAKAGDNNDITSTSKLTNINTDKLTLSKDLTVGSEVRAGYRFGVIRSTPYPAYMTFVRTDQVDGVAPASETSIFNIYGRLASATDDEWNGRALGGLTVSNMSHGGGKTILDARAVSGNVTARLWLDSGNGSATLQGAGGLAITGGGGLSSDGAGLFEADAITLQLKPKTKDKAYYLRGKKSDDTLHWYFGQSRDSNDAVSWGNSITSTWLTLSGDGTGETNVSTMNFLNNAVVGGNLTVNRGADFTGPVNVLAKGATAVGDLTNAALVVTGSSSDGTQGITVNSFAPTITFIDRDADAAGFRLRGEGSSLRLDVDNRDNGVTWNQNIALFSDKGHLALGGGSDSIGRMLTIGNAAPGKGNMSGSMQIAAMAYANIGADAKTLGVGFGAELTVGDGNTGQTVADLVEFWGNSNIVNTNAAVTLLTSFRSYDKASASIATAYAFEGRQTARSGLSRWNLYMQGTAPNFLRGQTIIGGTDTTLPASYIALSVKGGLEVSDVLKANNSAEFRGQVSLISTTPYIDFNSSTTQLNDYDARILVDSTTAKVSGQAALNIIAANVNLIGSSRLKGQLVVDKDAHFDDAVYVRGTLFTTSHISIGNLGTGVFNTGSGSINIGDSDTGFVCPGDGILDFYANNVLTHRSTPNKLYVYGKIVTEDADGLRIRPGGGNAGMIHRFDGSNYYMLFTNQNDPDGTWNGLRPITVTASNGYVTMGHQLNVNGSVIAGDRLYSGGGGSFVQSDGNIYGGCWGGYLSNWVSNNFFSRGSGDVVQDVRMAGEGSGVMRTAIRVPAGCVMTGWWTEGSTPEGDTIFYRAIQKCVNGGWYTIGQL